MRKLLITATILAPAAASAGGYLIPSSNARDLALSGATVADQSGAESVFLNTAALAGQEGLAISASGELLYNQTEWSDPSLGSASLNTQANLPPNVAISYGRKLAHDRAWGVGVGVGVPAGGSLVWPDGWPGQERIQSVKQQVWAIGGGAAFQPLPFLKLGATYVRYQAVEELHQEINYLDHFGDAGLTMSGGGNTFGLAAEVKVPQIPLRFGVNYTRSANLDLSGHVHFAGVPAAFQTLLHDQGATQTMLVPDVVFAGAAYDLLPNLTIMGAYSFEHWSSYEEDKFIGDDVLPDGSQFSVTVPRSYKNAHVIRVAGEWKQLPFLPQLTGRVGVLRSISDQPTETLSPTLTDASSTAFSIGAGYDIMPALRVDLGYSHAFFDTVTATGPDAFQGTYKTGVDLISLGINWRTDLGLGSGAPAK